MRVPLRLRLKVRRLRGLAEGYEAWKKDHDEAMQACDMDDLVEACLADAADAERFWEEIKGELSEWSQESLDAIGQFIGDFLERVERTLQEVVQDARRITNTTGHDIKGVGSLIEAAARLKDLRSSIMKNWPWENEPWPPLNKEMRDRARSGQDGPGESSEDFLRRMEAGGPLA